MRITREHMLMEMAFTASRRGTCDRLHVGAIIARESRPISLGYVGAPAGEPHCNPIDCDTSKPCSRTIHAEMNAIRWAEKYQIDIVGADMFVTDSPCYACACAIEKAKIRSVFFKRRYRREEGILFLESKNIKVVQLELYAPQS